LLLRQSGGIFEASALARPLEISRTTVANYLAVLEQTMVMHVVRPYAAGGGAEIVSAPRVYGFDSGFSKSNMARTRLEGSAHCRRNQPQRVVFAA
jgi:hypothetical protein